MNFEFSVAITQNILSDSNFIDGMRFLTKINQDQLRKAVEAEVEQKEPGLIQRLSEEAERWRAKARALLRKEEKKDDEEGEGDGTEAAGEKRRREPTEEDKASLLPPTKRCRGAALSHLFNSRHQGIGTTTTPSVSTASLNSDAVQRRDNENGTDRDAITSDTALSTAESTLSTSSNHDQPSDESCGFSFGFTFD